MLRRGVVLGDGFEQVGLRVQRVEEEDGQGEGGGGVEGGGEAERCVLEVRRRGRRAGGDVAGAQGGLQGGVFGALASFSLGAGLLLRGEMILSSGRVLQEGLEGGVGGFEA